MRLVLVLLALLTVPVLAQEASPEPPYAIVQGVSGRGIAQFGIQVKRGESLKCLVRPGGAGTPLLPVIEERITYDASDWEQIRLTFDGLEADVDHELMVTKDAKLIDKRVFRVPDWTAAKGRIMVASCLDDSFAEQKPMWADAFRQKPDAIFLIGDSAYCDVANGKLVRQTTPLLIWQRHAETRSKLALYRSSRLIPVFSVWDDHDYGLNDAGREFEHKRASARVYRAFFPAEPIDGFYERGPGVSGGFTMFGQRWLLLDGRTFRSPNRTEVPDETMFGARQEAWIQGALAKPGPLWIVNGAQMFGGYHRFESYEACQPRSFRSFVKMVREGQASVAFVSGDRHLAEVSTIGAKEVGFDTAELTTSGFHARTFPDAWKNAPNPRQAEGVSGKLNYAILDVEAGDTLRAKCTVWGFGMTKFFEHALDVKRGDG